MRSHPIHLTPLPFTPTLVEDLQSLSLTQGAYGSPISCLPSPTIVSPSLSPIPPDGTIYRYCESPQFYTAPTTFVKRTYVNSPARLSEHKVVRQLKPLYGQNLASGSNPSQGSPAPRPHAGGEAGPSSPNNSAGEWEIRPSLSTRENRRSTTNDRPIVPPPVEQPGWGTEVLIPVRRYEGDVDISIITCIGRAPDDIYEPQTSRYHVIGLTDNIIIIMETSEID